MIPTIHPSSQILVIQNTKEVKEIRFLKGETGKTQSAADNWHDVEHPLCHMDTKQIFVKPDEDFTEKRGMVVWDQRFNQLCRGLQTTCCSYNELKSLMDITKARVVDTLADLLVDFTTLHRTLLTFSKTLVEGYVDRKTERVKNCTGMHTGDFKNYYRESVSMMSQLEDDGINFKIVTLMNKYYRYLSVQSFEDNCRLCNPIENRYMYFNEQFLKYEIEFGYKEIFKQYYNRTFYHPDILRLIVTIHSLECITSYSTSFIKINEIVELEKSAAYMIKNNKLPNQSDSMKEGFMQFMSFNPFVLRVMKFHSVSKVFALISSSSTGDSGSFFERHPTFEIHRRTYYPDFTKRNSIYNYNHDYGFFADASISFNEKAATEYTEALQIFKHSTIYAVTIITAIIQLILF